MYVQVVMNGHAENALRSNDQKIRFYTGLPSFIVLETVFKFVSSHHNTVKFLIGIAPQGVITFTKRMGWSSI